LSLLIASGAVGLFLMLALPGLATADPAVAEPVAAATPTSEATPVDPVAGSTPPADEATPPVEEEQPAEPAVPSGEVTTPVTDDGAGAAPAPPPSESAPVSEPVADGSTPAPQPVEAAPAPSTGSSLPQQPDVPVIAEPRPAAALAATTWDAPAAPTQTVTLPKGPEAQVAPVVAATAPDPAPAADRPERTAPPAPRDLTRFAFDASGPIAQPITAPREAAPVPFREAQPPEGLTIVLSAPQNASPTSSLLAVLASYILPGTGPVPPGAMVMLVLLGLILAAVCAPRPSGSERIWLSGLLGPSTGHGLAVRRPG
jgi:hypothetical protein